MDNHRLDLSKEDGANLENLKEDLTESLENESKNVIELVNYFNRGASVSAPNSPSRCKVPKWPVRGHSIPDLSNKFPINLNMSLTSELEPLRATRTGLKEDLSAEIDDPNNNYGDLDETDSAGPTLQYTYNLEPEELQSFHDQDIVSETVEDISIDQGPSEPSLNIVNETEQVSNREPESSSKVSSRGRVRKAASRPLDNDFIWE